jgi:FAD-dependent urate hydroxylase
MGSPVQVAVVGAGLGGCAAVLGLRLAGAEVCVFEASDAPRRGGHSLSVFPSGTAALAALGVDKLPGVVIDRVTQMRQRSGRTISSLRLAPVVRLVGGSPYVVCPRQDLVDLLLAKVGRVSYAMRCIRVTSDDKGAHVCFADGSQVRADLVVAADGSDSQIRGALWPESERSFLSVVWQATVPMPANYPAPAEALIVRGPCTFAGSFPTTVNRVNLFFEQKAPSPETTDAPWPEVSSRFAALPDPLRRWFLDTPMTRFEAFPIFQQPPARRWYQGRVVLLGDAAHSLSPSGGQGSTEAFVDAVALGRAVRHSATVAVALNAYSQARYRRSQRAFRQSSWPMRPIASRMIAMSISPPDFLATRAAAVLMRPDPVVRQAINDELAQPT